MQTTRRAVAAAVPAWFAVLATSSFTRAGDAVVFTFTSGTGDAPGKITVTNAGNGSTASVGLVPKMSAAACASMLADAAPKVGFKTELGGASVTILGHGVVVKVEGASVTTLKLRPPAAIISHGLPTPRVDTHPAALVALAARARH